MCDSLVPGDRDACRSCSVVFYDSRSLYGLLSCSVGRTRPACWYLCCVAPCLTFEAEAEVSVVNCEVGAVAGDVAAVKACDV